MDNEYELRYLPFFYEDMYEKVTYIREKLLNPDVADELINAVEKVKMIGQELIVYFQDTIFLKDIDIPKVFFNQF